MSQNSQRTIRYVFTPEQIAERKQFNNDLENGKADIAFEGTRLEAKAFLDGVNQLVEGSIH